MDLITVLEVIADGQVTHVRIPLFAWESDGENFLLKTVQLTYSALQVCGKTIIDKCMEK